MNHKIYWGTKKGEERVYDIKDNKWKKLKVKFEMKSVFLRLRA